MKSNAEIRRESFKRLCEKTWFARLMFLTLVFALLPQLAGRVLEYAYARFGIQTWLHYLQAKASALSGGLDYAVPSNAVALEMYEATAFWLFISLIFSGISYLALATINIKAANDDSASCCRDAFGVLANPLGCAWLAAVLALRIALWSLLLIVPGVVASYRYSQVWNIKAENPHLGAGECIAESARMMKGRKMQRFRLDLSFAGWLLAAAAIMAGAFMIGVPVISAVASIFFASAAFFIMLWISVARAVFYRSCCQAANLV